MTSLTILEKTKKSKKFNGVFEDSDDEQEKEVNMIDAEIDYNFQDKYNTTVKNFTNFMSNTEWLTNPNDPNTNIADMYCMHKGVFCKKTFNIPDSKISKMFKYLELCRREKAFTMVYEKQQEYSGIMLDFDMVQLQKHSVMNEGILSRVCTEALGVIFKYVKMAVPDVAYDDKTFKIHAAIIKKPNVKFIRDKEAYKDGFHILIPSIKVKREVKRFIIQKLKQDEKFLQLFNVVELREGSYADIIDANSAHVPVYFVGSSSKQAMEPYNLFQLYESVIKVDDLNNEFVSPVINSIMANWDLTNMESPIVVCHELSLNYENKSKNAGIVKKRKYEIKEQYLAEVNAVKGTKDEEDAIDAEFGAMSILSIHDTEADYIRDLLNTLNPRRYIEFGPWFQVMCVLAHTSKSYKPLAEDFSQKCEEKYSPVDFEHHWQSAMIDKQNKLNIGSLHYWAKLDNPIKYDEVRQNSIYTIVYKKVYDTQLEGSLQHYDIAQILFKSLRHKFIYDDYEGGTWYEFILKEDMQKPGEVYKWRTYNRAPNSLKRYISEILPDLFRKVFDKIDERIETADTNDIAKWLMMIKINLKTTCRKLRDSTFKNGIMREAEQVFQKINFSESLDKDPEIMGVGNGILKLGNTVQFIAGHHNYLVSMHTPVEYIPFDPYNPITKKLLCALRNLFPDHKPDTFEFIMCFLASSLDGKKKESLIILLIGTGSNGKTSLLELLRETISVYAVKMSLSFLTHRQKNAEGATPALMVLEKARIAMYSEAERSETLLMSKVKEITGQEALAGRKLHGDQRNIKPACNHIVASNYDFEIPGNDHGSWRRIIYIPMEIKLCKPNVDEYDEDNPYERLADPSIGSKWSEDPEIKSAFLSILCYYYEILHSKYDGLVENVPHPHIVQETEEYRDRQDKINNFINIRFVKVDDKDLMVPMATVIEKYTKWHESLYPDDKDYKKSIANQFENSKLSKIIRKTKTGVYVMGYRILDAGEEPEDGETYFMDGLNPKKTSVANITPEPTAQYYARVCEEYDSVKASEDERIKTEIELLRKKRAEMLRNKPVIKDLPELAQSSKVSNNVKESEKNYDQNGFKKPDMNFKEFVNESSDDSDSDNSE